MGNIQRAVFGIGTRVEKSLVKIDKVGNVGR
jgi:hypothetical protein